jgi:methionine biosynthesis protein MetW
MRFDSIRQDHKLIYELIEPGAKVLDLGCGDGELMFLLAKEKSAKVQGIEIDEKSIYKCVEKGLSVFHSDIDSGLHEYPDKSFDYVVLNQSLQQTRKIEFVIKESMRVARTVIVGFPNFAFYKARFDIFFKGRAPVTRSLPYRWYDTPNTHFLSIKDFKEYCARMGFAISAVRYLNERGPVRLFPNLFATDAIFCLRSGSPVEGALSKNIS